MVFQVQFAAPHRQIGVLAYILFQLFKELRYMGHSGVGAARDPLGQPPLVFQHFPGGPSAAVPVAAGHQSLLVQVFLAVPFPGSLDLGRIDKAVISGEKVGPVGIVRRVLIIPGGHKMRQDLRAIDPPPHERIIGHAVEFIPVDLSGHEIPDPCLFHDLGQGR